MTVHRNNIWIYTDSNDNYLTKQKKFIPLPSTTGILPPSLPLRGPDRPYLNQRWVWGRSGRNIVANMGYTAVQLVGSMFRLGKNEHITETELLRSGLTYDEISFCKKYISSSRGMREYLYIKGVKL